MTDELGAAIEAAGREWQAANNEAAKWAQRAEVLKARVDALRDAARLRPAAANGVAEPGHVREFVTVKGLASWAQPRKAGSAP